MNKTATVHGNLYQPHSMTPHEGAIQFLLSWYDSLPADTALQTIEYIVQFAASDMDDLRNLGCNYLPEFVVPSVGTQEALNQWRCTVTKWRNAVIDCINDMLIV